MTSATPTLDDLPRRYADFDTLTDALDYAARGRRGVNFYSGRGDLVEALTWTDIRERAVALARKLSGLGFERGDRIALIAETSADFVIFFLGAQYVNVLPVPLPLPTSFGGKEGYISQLRAQMSSCSASGVMAPAFMQEMVDQAASGLEMRFTGNLQDYMAQPDNGPLHLPAAEDLSYLQYSSGSTRFPHGVSVTHRSLLSNTHGIGKYGVCMQDDDRCVSWLPFYHDMGLVGTFLTTATMQCSVDFVPTEEFARRPLTWLRVISKNGGTITYSPTFGFDICTRRVGLRSSALEELDLSSLRVAGIGGDLIRPDVMCAFHEAFGPVGFKAGSFLPSYGLAECTLGVSFGQVGRGILIEKVEEARLAGDRHVLVNGAANAPRYRDVVNCGRPLPEYELDIRGEDGKLAEEGVVGRIYVRGPSVMAGYYNDPEATEAVLSPDGWLDTGDMGFLKNGDLFIVGRAKDIIIVNGRNHWPQDIEWAAEQLPGVKNGDVAAISIPGENAEEMPMILAQCRVKDNGERNRLVDEMRRHIQQETGINCVIELVPPRSLPRTSSGKLSRSKARNQYLSGRLQAIAS